VTELSAEATHDLARHWGDPDLHHASSLADGAGFAILQQKDSVSLQGQLHVSKVVIQKPAGLKEPFPGIETALFGLGFATCSAFTRPHPACDAFLFQYTSII
jgi:hypothetical protein